MLLGETDSFAIEDGTVAEIFSELNTGIDVVNSNLGNIAAPDYASAVTPVSQNITSGVWEYTAPCNGLLILNATLTAVTAVAFGIKGTGVTTFYEQNYASQPARMTRIIPMAEGDVFNVTDCVHANVTTATKFVPYKDNAIAI